ncbi:MAG: SH3 domain-containing protein [Hyphomicrobiales bacterium]|nr:MAG: SH3 domain-containing protein [Hyphomicrobiales bacterium]
MQPFILAAALIALVAPAAAAEARATGNLPIHSGPGQSYRVIGTLPDGVSVGLSRCTRQSRWCRIVYDDGPNGWVLGSYLVGSAAKMHVTPPEFTNPMRLFD